MCVECLHSKVSVNGESRLGQRCATDVGTTFHSEVSENCDIPRTIKGRQIVIGRVLPYCDIGCGANQRKIITNNINKIAEIRI